MRPRGMKSQVQAHGALISMGQVSDCGRSVGLPATRTQEPSRSVRHSRSSLFRMPPKALIFRLILLSSLQVQAPGSDDSGLP